MHRLRLSLINHPWSDLHVYFVTDDPIRAWHPSSITKYRCGLRAAPGGLMQSLGELTNTYPSGQQTCIHVYSRGESLPLVTVAARKISPSYSDLSRATYQHRYYTINYYGKNESVL